MEALSNVIKVSIPNYFANLPVPSSICCIAKLSVRDWLSLVPAVGGFAFVVYATSRVYLEQKPAVLKVKSHHHE